MHDQQIGAPSSAASSATADDGSTANITFFTTPGCAEDEADRVPVVGRLRRIPLVQLADDVIKGGHGHTLGNRLLSAACQS